MQKTNYTKEEILDILIESVMTFNPSLYKQCLWSETLEINAVNKMMYYWYYKGMLKRAKTNSVGELYLKIKKKSYNSDALYYNFYDNIHIYDRLSIEIIEFEDKLHIDVMPF